MVLHRFEYTAEMCDCRYCPYYRGKRKFSIEMEEYFDFSGFGEYFAEEHDGQFVNGGFVYFDSDRSLDEFLEELVSEDEGMDMGGM